MTSMIRLRTLGDCTIEVGETRIGPDSAVLFAFLLYLTVEREHPTPRARLRELLWPDVPERKAWHSLRQLLYRARLLGIEIEATAGHVRLVTDVEADYASLDATLGAGDTPPSDPQPLYRAFLHGYLPTFSRAFGDWVDCQRSVVESRLRHALVHRVCLARASGRWAEMERISRLLLEVDPLNEEATLCLAEAMALAGSKAEAVAVLDRYVGEINDLSNRKLELAPAILRRRISERMPAPPTSRPTEAPFVGRADNLRTLCGMLEIMRGGFTANCFVWGPAGIGKTRLVDELGGIAALEGVCVVRVNCHPSDTHRPLGPIADLVLQLLRLPGAIGCSPESLDLLKRLARQQRTEGGAATPTQTLLPAHIQSAVADLVQSVAVESRVMIVVEDVHWADVQSVAALSRCAGRRDLGTVAFVITSRDRPDSHSWLGTTTRVDALRYEECQTLTRLLIAVPGETDPAVVDRCAQLSEGNPFYVRELVQHWRATGGLETVPPSLGALLSARLGALNDEALRTLQALATLGRNSSPARARRLLGYPNAVLLDAIEKLSAAGLVSATGATLGCTHELVARAALAAATETGLCFLHRLSAEVLEQDADGVLDTRVMWDCARHWKQAGEADRALSYALRCAHHLLELGLTNDAVDLLERARELCDHTERLEVVLRALVRAHYQARRFPEVLAVRKEHQALRRHLHAVYDSHDEDELLYLEAEWQADAGNYATAFDHVLRCVSAVDAPRDHRLAAALQCLMIAGNSGDEAMGRAVHNAVAGLLPDEPSVDEASTAIEMVFHTTFGSLDRAIVAAQGLLWFARRRSNQASLVRTLLNCAYPTRMSGRTDEAEQLLMEALATAKRTRLTHLEFRAQLQLANHYRVLNNLAAAQGWVEQASRADSSLFDPLDRAALGGAEVEIALARGDVSTAEQTLATLLGYRFDQRLVRAAAESTALKVRLLLLMGSAISEEDIANLRRYHIRLRSQGSHDTCGHALFAGLRATGKLGEATVMLAEYVGRHRRERTSLEPSLSEFALSIGAKPIQ